MVRKKSPFLMQKILEMKKNANGVSISNASIARELNVSVKTVSKYLNCPEIKAAQDSILKGILGVVGQSSALVSSYLDVDYAKMLKNDELTPAERVEIARLANKQAEMALQLMKTLGREQLSSQPKVVKTESLLLSNTDRKDKEAELKNLLAAEMAEEQAQLPAGTKENTDG